MLVNILIAALVLGLLYSLFQNSGLKAKLTKAAEETANLKKSLKEVGNAQNHMARTSFEWALKAIGGDALVAVAYEQDWNLLARLIEAELMTKVQIINFVALLRAGKSIYFHNSQNELNSLIPYSILPVLENYPSVEKILVQVGQGDQRLVMALLQSLEFEGDLTEYRDAILSGELAQMLALVFKLDKNSPLQKGLVTAISTKVEYNSKFVTQILGFTPEKVAANFITQPDGRDLTGAVLLQFDSILNRIPEWFGKEEAEWSLGEFFGYGSESPVIQALLAEIWKVEAEIARSLCFPNNDAGNHIGLIVLKGEVKGAAHTLLLKLTEWRIQQSKQSL